MDIASLNVLKSRYTSQTSNDVTFCKIQHIYSASAMDVASLNVLKSRYTSQMSNDVTFCKIQHIYSASAMDRRFLKRPKVALHKLNVKRHYVL